MERGTNRVVDIDCDHDVVVFQRLTHGWMAQAVLLLRAKGVAVVIDVDDDMTSIHPSNPAFAALHPTAVNNNHSWGNLKQALRDATVITVSTPALAQKYRAYGKVVLLRNYLAAHYYGRDRHDHTGIVWPASLHSHPNDPAVLGNAMSRVLQSTDVSFGGLGHPAGLPTAFGLPASLAERVWGSDPVPLLDWPQRVAAIGIGIAPLADTAFNRAKSWLKPLELSACGVPWVGSPQEEYAILHASGAGLLARSPKEWYRRLRNLIFDAELRKQISQAGKEAAQVYKLDRHVHLWAEAWQDAYALQRG